MMGHQVLLPVPQAAVAVMLLQAGQAVRSKNHMASAMQAG